MRLTLRAFAALLGYPSAELQAHASEVADAIRSEGVLPRADLRRLQPLFDRLAATDLLDQQATYSELFDRSRSLSLHLFEHVHGDSRERGQAMILCRAYKAAGVTDTTGRRLLDRMESEGLITRRRAPRSRKMRIVELTDRSVALLVDFLARSP